MMWIEPCMLLIAANRSAMLDGVVLNWPRWGRACRAGRSACCIAC